MEQKQHPIFVKYTRSWLHEMTGYSKGYLCRVATGKISLSRAFIERVCFKLQMPEEDLFLDLVEPEPVPDQEQAPEAEAEEQEQEQAPEAEAEEQEQEQAPEAEEEPVPQQ